MGDVIPLPGRRPEPSRPPLPPAPNPDDVYSTTLGQVFDGLLYLFDAGEHHTLRRNLMDYSIALDGVPLPDGVFEDEDEGTPPR